MSQEIQATLNATITNGGYGRTLSQTAVIDQAVQKVDESIVSLSTSEADLSEADIATNGMMYLKNLDAAITIHYGPKSGGVMINFASLKAGEFAWFRLRSGVTVRAVAASGTPKLHYIIYND